MALEIVPSARASRHGSVMDLQILCELLRKSGFDPSEFLSGAGISPTVLARPGAQITRRQERDFHALFASATSHRPDMWIESGLRNQYNAWGVFGMANITAPTLRHIRRLAATQGCGAGQYHLVHPDRSFSGVAVAFDTGFVPGTPGFVFEVVRETISGVALYNELWGTRFPFAYIQVPAAAAAFDLSAHVDAPFRFADGPLMFVWPIELEDAPLPRGDEFLHRQYLAMLDLAGRQALPSVHSYEQLCDVLSQMSDTGSGLTEAAAELGVSTRTLQRRLAEHGIDFRSLRTEARLRKAQRMLRTTDASIREIASSVGYVEVSSFSHAFRRWAGESPREYRLRAELSSPNGLAA